MKLILLYLLTIPVFAAMDILWLGLIGRNIYKKYLGHLMAENTTWSAAILFYLFFIGGILYFAVLPALKEGNFSTAVINGAVYGFITYMTYELTNMAVIKDWAWGIVPIDIIWGTVLCMGVATASFGIGKWLGV